MYKSNFHLEDCVIVTQQEVKRDFSPGAIVFSSPSALPLWQECIVIVLPVIVCIPLCFPKELHEEYVQIVIFLLHFVALLTFCEIKKL